MDVILEQYFDLDIINDNFSIVLDGFWQTLLLSLIGGALALTWGLVKRELRDYCAWKGLSPAHFGL